VLFNAGVKILLAITVIALTSKSLGAGRYLFLLHQLACLAALISRISGTAVAAASIDDHNLTDSAKFSHIKYVQAAWLSQLYVLCGE
jgi:hypothetical protein